MSNIVQLREDNHFCILYKCMEMITVSTNIRVKKFFTAKLTYACHLLILFSVIGKLSLTTKYLVYFVIPCKFVYILLCTPVSTEDLNNFIRNLLPSPIYIYLKMPCSCIFVSLGSYASICHETEDLFGWPKEWKGW